MTDRTHPDSGFPIAYSHYANYAEYVEALHARIAELEAQLESIGAGGVSGPLMGQPQAMPDLSALTERGAKAWAGVDAQGLREGFTAADMAQQPATSAAAEHAETMRRIGEGQAFEAWFKVDCPVEGVNARIAAKAAWQARAALDAPQPSPTPQADSQPAPMGQNESAYQRGYMDGMAKGRREAEAGGHAAPQPAVQQGDTEVLLIAAVDEWFAKNTGLGGCSDKDVQELQAIFAADRAARALEDSVTAPATDSYVQPVPDKCDRIVQICSAQARRWDMTEPTDAEAWEMWLSQPLTGHAQKLVGNFARAVLAKWGTPAVAGEPDYATFALWYADHIGDENKPVRDAALATYEAFATPQPTQAQAGAVPLYRLLQSGVDRIEAADEFLSDDTTAWAIDPNGIFVGSIYGGHVLRPARRCIKGGQHGAE